MSLFCLLAAITAPLPDPLPQTLRELNIQAEMERQSFASLFTQLTQGICESAFDVTFLKSLAGAKGEVVQHWENGQIKFKATFVNGLPEGHFHGYYQNGADAFKGYISKSIKQGVHIAFFPGDPDLTRTHKGRILSYNLKGVLNGNQQAFFGTRGNELKSHAVFKEGVLDGLVITWNDQRQRIEDLVFKEGKPGKQESK